MISLTRKPRNISNTSWLSRPVNTSAARLDNQDAVAFWLAYSFAFDDTEPLPAMFRRKTPAANARAQSAADNSGYTTAPAGRLSRFRATNMTASYILGCVLLFFATMDAALLTMARFSPDRAAATQSVLEKGAVETAALSSSIETTEPTQTPAIDQAANDLLFNRLATVVNASAEKPAEATGVCAMPSLNCWKSATFIR
jgi:hypothetical protein